MNNTPPKVLIVILNYGTFDLTLKLIDEIKKNLLYDNYSIMVVDNCSPNESAEVLDSKSKEMGFLFYANKRNAGYAAGNNIGIRYGIEHSFDYSWILNNDVELREGNILEHMIGIAEKDGKIGCVGPRIVAPDETVCAPYVRRPTFWSMTFGVLGERKKRKRHIDKSGIVYRVHGCCMLLRNTTMKAVNCMDERTFLYGEEDILAERMLDKSYNSYYDADVGITHKDSASMKRMSKNRKRLQMTESRKSRELYLKDYRHMPAIKRFFCHMTRNLIEYIR